MHKERIVDIAERVNKKNTKLWFMMNENSRAALHRDQFVKENGGMFYNNDKGEWLWRTEFSLKNGYWLMRQDTGEKVFFENMSEFCRKHDLSIVKICEIMNGKRKSYKGWIPVEIRPVKENSGAPKNIGENPETKKKYEVFYQTAIFKNWLTNEIVLVTNIPDFAKKINGDFKELYNLAQGKKKFYKEWTLATSTEMPPSVAKPKTPVKKVSKKES
jgi:hypothetical protein